MGASYPSEYRGAVAPGGAIRKHFGLYANIRPARAFTGVRALGTAPSLNCSATRAMAQAVHGAAPTLAGRNRANSVAAQLSAAMSLHWLGARDGDRRLGQAGARIEHAVAATFEAGIATADLGGLASTSEFTEQVLARTRLR